MRSSAMSVPGSDPTSCALKTRRSLSVTTISWASLTTWWLVRTSPRAASTITPEPAARSWRCCWSGMLNHHRKNGSRASGLGSCDRVSTAMLTTAGVTCASIGASVGTGWPSAAGGSARRPADAAAKVSGTRNRRRVRMDGPIEDLGRRILGVRRAGRTIASPKPALRRSRHARASGEIFGTVDVAEDAGIVAVDELDGGARALQEFARARVTGEALEVAAESRRESDGMPALAPPRRRDDRGARRQPLDDPPDRFRTDERHVGKSDHPAVRVPGSADGMGERRAHALLRPLAHGHFGALAAQALCELERARSDHRDDARKRSAEVAKGGDGDRRPVGKRVEELVRAEPRRGARGEKDADDASQASARGLARPRAS